MIDRRWDVDPTTQPSSGKTVGVRYYYTKTEYDSLVTVLASSTIMGSGNTSTITSTNQLYMFKLTIGNPFDAPHTSGITGIILANGASADTPIWHDSTHGNTDHYAEFLVESFSGGGGGAGGGVGAGAAGLPVELIQFTAIVLEHHQAQLNWATATEINNSHFKIERSYDGYTFGPLGRIEGNGNTN